MRSRLIIKEQTTAGIGANAHACLGSFRHNICCRTGDGGEQPLEAALPCDEFDLPVSRPLRQFVVALCDSQHLIDRFDPLRSYFLLSHQGRENEPRRSAEPPSLSQQRFGGCRIGFRQHQKLRTAIRGDNLCRLKKVDEAIPGKLGRSLASVGKIDGKTSPNQG